LAPFVSCLPLKLPTDGRAVLPVILQGLREVASCLLERRTQLSFIGLVNPSHWRYYLATLRLLAAISDMVMTVPFRDTLVTLYHTIFDLAERHFREF
jgi:hypothetical protein